MMQTLEDKARGETVDNVAVLAGATGDVCNTMRSEPMCSSIRCRLPGRWARRGVQHGVLGLL